MGLRILGRIRLPKINIRTRLSGLPKPVRLFLTASFLVILAVGTPAAGLAGYNYYMAGRELANCERLFADDKFGEAAVACETSVTYWFRQSVKDKAKEAGDLAISHAKYLEGLKVFGDRKWKEAVNLLSLVIEEDPGYPDAVEKLAQAKKEIEAQKVAGAQAKAAKPKVVYVPSSTQKKSTPPPTTDTKTQKKISDLEKKVTELEKPKTPPQPDTFTLSLDQSEISAVVMLWCVDTNYELLPYYGSGTIYDPNGYIFTNRHVVEQQDGSVAFTFCAVGITGDISQPPEFKYWAALYAYSPSVDVADLTILWDIEVNLLPETTSFPYLEIGSSGPLTPSDSVWIEGYPSSGDGTWTLTEGIISGKSGSLFKTDAQVDTGNSGGAALDKNKKFVGIPTAYIAGGGETLGYFIGIDTVLNLTDWVTLY